MSVLLLSGLGPTMKNHDLLAGTFLDALAAVGDAPLHAGLGRRVRPHDVRFTGAGGGEDRSVLRPRKGVMPHLTTATLESILTATEWEFESFPLEQVWSGEREPATLDHDVVALSTTFICNAPTLRRAIRWVRERYPRAVLIVGGQYGNVKYAAVLRECPEVDFVVRGDGELAFPALLAAIRDGTDPTAIPNVVVRTRTLMGFRTGDLAYVDLERHPSPRFQGSWPVVPYESMRGCPFTCRFCSFPFASPEWRYKSADKIVRDWSAYREANGATLIKALDSTFTVPPSRFHALLERLPEAGVSWEAYTRANVIDRPATVRALEESRCATLSIGFESMSDASLRRMHKQVSAAQNERANELLADSAVDFRASFMIGYPGETPEEYEETHRYLVERFAGRFMVSVFSLTDETMPVWEDRHVYDIQVADPDDPDYSWSHSGMDVDTARALHRRTLREARWGNERGVLLLWQMQFQMPLLPELPRAQNYRIEKLLERLAFAPLDHADDPERVTSLTRGLVDELGRHGVHVR